MKDLVFQAIVVGCGVSGLTCGIRLLEHGFAVTIVARELSPNTTSDAAAAYWFPNGIKPVEKVLAWSRSSYQTFQELAKVELGPRHGDRRGDNRTMRRLRSQITPS